MIETSEIHRFINNNGQDNEETNNFDGPEEYCGVLSFDVTGKLAASNIFVFINSMGTARQLEIEQNLEFLAILIRD